MEHSVTRRTAIVLLAAATAGAQARLVPTVDEEKRDPTLAAYMTRFRIAVGRRDRAALLPMIDPDVRLSFGSDSGVENFRPDWPLMDRLLAMGGAWVGDSFALPYVFARFPGDRDPFEHAAITGRDVWLREAASSTSRGVRRLDHEIVRVIDQGEQWWKVETLGGVSGYVAAGFVYSPIGYRAIFEKSGGIWKMTAFLAGD
jgi:hypothetical protein